MFNEDGSLSIEIDGSTWIIREPLGRDLVDTDRYRKANPDCSEMDIMVSLLARLVGKDRDDILDLPASDFLRLGELMATFRIGEPIR